MWLVAELLLTWAGSAGFAELGIGNKLEPRGLSHVKDSTSVGVCFRYN